MAELIDRADVTVKNPTDVSAYLVQEYGLSAEKAVDLCLTPYGEKEVNSAIRLRSKAYCPGDKIMAHHETPKTGGRPESFQKQLEELINCCSKENESNTPDFILAEYMNSCLKAYTLAHNKTCDWHKEGSRSGTGTKD